MVMIINLLRVFVEFPGHVSFKSGILIGRVRDIMHALVTYKFIKDLIKGNRER